MPKQPIMVIHVRFTHICLIKTLLADFSLNSHEFLIRGELNFQIDGKYAMMVLTDKFIRLHQKNTSSWRIWRLQQLVTLSFQVAIHMLNIRSAKLSKDR
jgi:hypothetical protein